VSRDPVPIGDSLDSVLRSLRSDPMAGSSGAKTDATTAHPASQPASQASQMGGVFGRWAEIVGDAVAAHVTPVKLDGAKLVVEVDDPAWATQLRFLEAAMKQRLREVAGAEIEVIEARVRRF
jgi:predicted nucleic acid-binding Zn ribbon protein